MARGQRKTLDEKIEAKEEIITALLTRVESEKRELAELYKAKREAALENIGSMIEDSGLSAEEAASALKMYIQNKAVCVS